MEGLGVRRKKSLAETKVSGQMFLRKININRHDAFETLLIVYLSSAYPNFPQTSLKLPIPQEYRGIGPPSI